MLAYRLRHRVRIENYTEGRDPNTGAVINGWEVFLDNVPAEVLTGPGREFYQSGATQSEVAARINMRWFPDLTQEMRIIWNGVIYNIASIETDLTGRREYRLRCTGGVNEG